MSPSYSPRPSSPPTPPPTHYPYYSPPPPPPACNMTKPKTPPPPPPPPPPVLYNCTCLPVTPYYPPTPNTPYYPPTPNTPYYPPTPNTPYHPPTPNTPYGPAPPPYIVQHDYKAVIAVSVSLGGFLVAFLVLGVLFLAKRKPKPEEPQCQPSPPTPPAHPYAPVHQPQTETITYEVIQVEEAGDAAAAGAPSYAPASVAHDHARHNYG